MMSLEPSFSPLDLCTARALRQKSSLFVPALDQSFERWGRFPGQDKFDVAVGDYTGDGAQAAVVEALDGDGTGDFDAWNDAEGSKWRSVFGISNADNPQAAGGVVSDDEARACNTCPGGLGSTEWLALFAGNTLSSKYQDGHFIYVVIAGGGSGLDVYPPVLYVADAENPSDFNNLLEP